MVKVTSIFKLVFGTVVSLTLISGVTALRLASQEHLSVQQKQIIEHCEETWQTGIGAVFGLLGGRAVELLHEEEEEKKEHKK
jgi:hypothetical protein